MDWIGAAHYCITLGLLPTTQTTAAFVNESRSGSQLWTGVTRSMAIMHEYDKMQGNNIARGILVKHGDKLLLNFTKDRKPRRALCFCTEPANETTSAKQTLTAGSNVNVTNGKPLPTTTEMDSKTTLLRTTFSHEFHNSATTMPGEVSEASGRLAVPVGVAVVIVVLIGVAIAAIIYLKRRNMECFKKSDHEISMKRAPNEPNAYNMMTKNNMTVRDDITPTILQRAEQCQPIHVFEKAATISEVHSQAMSESHYNYIDIDENLKERQYIQDDNIQYSHTYLVLEKHEKALTEDNTYNVTNANKRTFSRETDDMYSKFDKNNTATYDHVQKRDHCSNLHMMADENTYDTKETIIKAEQQACKGNKRYYNTTFEFEENDTYNHLIKRNPGTADNVYHA